jgi:DNA mismatch repair ATPase MutL
MVGRPRRFEAHRRVVGRLAPLGLIGVGDAARPNRSGQSFFINGRVVQMPRCSTQAAGERLRGRVTTGMYPMCALHLEMPPSTVDV